MRNKPGLYKWFSPHMPEAGFYIVRLMDDFNLTIVSNEHWNIELDGNIPPYKSGTICYRMGMENSVTLEPLTDPNDILKEIL